MRTGSGAGGGGGSASVRSMTRQVAGPSTFCRALTMAEWCGRSSSLRRTGPPTGAAWAGRVPAWAGRWAACAAARAAPWAAPTGTSGRGGVPSGRCGATRGSGARGAAGRACDDFAELPRWATARAAGVLVPLPDEATGRAGRSTGNTGSGGASRSTGSVAGVGAGPAVAQANRGPLGARLPRDHPSAGHRAGRASGSRSRRSITRVARGRGRRSCSTTTTDAKAAATGSRCRRPGGARLRRALRKRRMLRFESGFEWTIQATAAMTTSHSPTANKLMTNPRIEPPPFRLRRHPTRPASSDANFRRRGLKRFWRKFDRISRISGEKC